MSTVLNSAYETRFFPSHSHEAWSPEELLCPINPLRTVRLPGIATSDIATVFRRTILANPLFEPRDEKKKEISALSHI